MKPLVWVGSSLEDLKTFPDLARSDIGHALYVAQLGAKHASAKPLKDYKGAGVLEVVERFSGNAYRVVYTMRLADRIYVLHAFQKESTSGIATPKSELELVQSRLAQAVAIHGRWLAARGEPEIVSRNDDVKITLSSGNVFQDLGFDDADDRLAKSKLAFEIARIIKARRLTQAAAAAKLGIDQPKVSRLLAGKLRGLSTEQLMRFLNALGQDVDIVIRDRPKARRGRLMVHAG
ncbi:MAG: XRE family transcriptional regulator [Hyphomicrobium sp.]